MKKVVVFIAVMVITLLVSVNCIYATSLNLEVKTDKNTAQIGDNITVTVDWKDGMQAADYILKYDSEKLDYISSSISDTYINKSQAGTIGISWFSGDDTNLSKMTFTFKVKKEGTADFSVQVDGGFADGQMNVPESYDVSSKSVKLTAKTTQTPSGDNNNDDNQSGGVTNQGNNNQSGGSNSQNNSNGAKPNNSASSENQNKPSKLPDAGDNAKILKTIGMILCIAIVVFYIKYRKYKEI